MKDTLSNHMVLEACGVVGTKLCSECTILGATSRAAIEDLLQAKSGVFSGGTIKKKL